MKQAALSPLTTLMSALALGLCVWTCAPVFASALPLAAALAPASTLPNFADLVEKAGPSVVNIRVAEKASAEPAADDADQQMQEFLRRYFGAPHKDGVPGGVPKGAKPPEGDDDAPQQHAVGSGFIIARDGYVLTNAHVVKDAAEIIVTLSDQREFAAKVVGLDQRTDVALLKIDADHLPPAVIGASSAARVGEWVIAIGSPFDLDHTVTAGIISAKARETGDFLPLIQTDVAVNPGNSGGPLINMRGEVVGINSQIYSQSGGYMGISFAIPIEDAIRVADQLKASGHVSRGRIGVYLGDVSKEVADSLGLPKAAGGLVGRIEKGGPADKAGLLGGDIIVNFNGVPVAKSADLRRLAADTKPGTVVKLTLWRKGAARDATLTVAELEPALAQAAAPEAPVRSAKLFGLEIGELPPAQKKELGLSTGVIVTDADGIAARAGLETGDIILTINNQDVTDVQQFSAALKQADAKKPLLLLARRGDVSQYITLRPKV